MDFIDWNSIEYKGNPKGKKKTICPKCSHTRTNKTDACLAVDFDKGLAFCHHCNAKAFRDKEENVSFELPSQEWRNFTNLSDAMVKWVRDERSISQKTLIELGITEEKHYQPKLKKEVNNIVFNYFDGEILVNKKYRAGVKAFTQSNAGKPLFYNINSIIGQKECYIVEGEFDVLALHEIGIKNVISVPNGANDNDNYWKNSKKYLDDIDKFVIATDNDEKGKELKEKIAQRLGRYRCEFIDFPLKDANAHLINGDLRDQVNKKQRFPVSGTFTPHDLKDDILSLYENGLPDTIKPKNEQLKGVNNIFSLMRGHLCTVTGIPSHGKSNFVDWYVVNLINDLGLKASFYSPEHNPMGLYQTNFIQKVIGRNFWKDMEGLPRITKEDIDRYLEWSNERLYLTGIENGKEPTWDWLIDKMKEQLFNFGIDIFVIDAFNKVQMRTGNLTEINKILTRLTNFAQANNVVIILVAHPTKMKKDDKTGLYDIPSLYDVSGSADFRNQTHDGFCIYRNFANDQHNGFSSFINLKTKMSFQGEIGGKVDFEYHIPSGRYYPRGQQYLDYDFTREVNEFKMQPNNEFDFLSPEDIEDPF